MSWLRNKLIRVVGWLSKRLFDFALLLRLFALVLEREAARSRPNDDSDDAQGRIDDGKAWLDFCDSLRGLVDFVLVGASPPAELPAVAQQPVLSDGAAAPGCAATGADHGGGDSPLYFGRGLGLGRGLGSREVAGVQLDALDRREGLRYFTRIVRGGLEAFMDCWDPAYPVLRPLPYNVKLGADNPDNLYMYGTVSGAFEYRLYGNRGSVTYLSFGCYCGSRPGQGFSQPAHLNSSELVTLPDGSFEVWLTSRPRGDNWLRLPPDASRLVVRQSFLDRGKEVAAEVRPQINIERLPLASEGCGGGGRAALTTQVGASGAASMPMRDCAGKELKPPLSAGQVVAGITGAAVFISGSIRQFQTWSRIFAARPNTLITLDHDVYMSAWADPAIHFFHGYWRLNPEEVLLIQVTPPDCPYWNFQTDNWWMESLDYVAHPETTTNKATASYMPDGSICLVVAHTDPRVAITRADGGPVEVREGEGESLTALLPPRVLAGVTWISTAHHAHGTMGLRWVLARQHPVPRSRVVRLGSPLARAIMEGVSGGG
ncbi:hypothetical protein Vafri_14701 [Volvox africanus]|uniref:Uncharacterized protein n=2 Tax=Volvox africanus TaxID=51714 RepID=A0A8J4F6W7_9CHLO|nr:hypothetical protein Vafri_14701 [Volvox africanus]